MKTFKEIDTEISCLERELVEAMKREYPIGVSILYFHGDNAIEAKVIRHNESHPRLFVEGATGKRYWIDAYRCV